ncbi:hypothetical protein ONZ45_g17457 [Pleurotus djamor]|nr:hypothetical protein ONZ45_g17457 [Pleurotus djamor]
MARRPPPKFCRSDDMYDHGPWPNMLSYFRAVIDNQILFIKNHAKDETPLRRPPFHRRDVHMSILETLLQTIPLVLPPPSHQIPLLWHPDLNAQNMIVSAEGQGASRFFLIDWQDTTVSPFFMQGTPPPLVIVDNVASNPRTAMMSYIGKLLSLEDRAPVLVYPHNGIIPLRKALYKIDELWDDLVEPGTLRPEALVKMCSSRVADEAEHVVGDGLLSDDQAVAQKTRDVIPLLKQQWATDDNFPEPYPFADGQYSFFLTWYP